MDTEHNAGEHYQSLEHHTETVDTLKKTQADYDLASGLRAEATPEEEQAAEAMMAEAKQEMDRARADYDQVIAHGKEVGNQEKNLELWLEAYQEHYEYLMSQARGLKQKIDTFRSTLQSDELFTQAKEQSLPPYVADEIGDDEVGRNRVRYVFMEMLGTEIANAKAKGLLPKDVLGSEQVDSLWQRAIRRYKLEPKQATLVKAPAGWTPWHKERP